MTLVPAAQYFSGRRSRRSLPNQWPAIGTDGSAVTLMASWTASGWVIPRLKRIETGIPTPTCRPFSGVYWPMKVFLGTRVVNFACSAASRPLASTATASTVYSVEAPRWPLGRHDAPPPDIFPATSLPFGSVTLTDFSLPFLAVTASAPLVATPSAPSLGAIVTAACEAARSLPAFPDAFPPSASSPPHAVTSSSIEPSSSASTPPLPCGRRRRAGSPAIGCTVTPGPFSPRRPRADLRSPARARTARLSSDNHIALTVNSPPRSPFSPKCARARAEISAARCPASTAATSCSSRRARCPERRCLPGPGPGSGAPARCRRRSTVGRAGRPGSHGRRPWCP